MNDTPSGAPVSNVEALAAELTSGAAADIWFDAADYPGEEAKERTIELTQNAMAEAARLLPQLVDALSKLSGFASHMALKHGIGGDNSLTMQEHELYQEAFDASHKLLEELQAPMPAEEAEEPSAPAP